VGRMGRILWQHGRSDCLLCLVA